MDHKLAGSVREIAPSLIREMSLRAASYKNVISLGIGDPDFHTSHEVCRAALDDALAGHTHYTPSRGDQELIAELIRYIRAERGTELEPEQLLITHGGMGGLTSLLKTLLNPAEEVIVPEPYFPSYQAQITLSGGVTAPVPTRFEDGFVVRPEAVEQAITSRTKVLLLNSPNNPTGSIIPGPVLDHLARLAVDRDLIVISDEVYDRLVFEGSYESISTRPGMAERCAVVNSFSKKCAMTGWRVGYAYGPAWLMNQAAKVVTFYTSCTASVSQRAALAALRMDQTGFKDMARRFKSRCALVHGRLSAMPGVRVHPAAGSFYLFPDISGVNRDSMRFALDLLDQEQVVVVPGLAFGGSTEGFVRISCTLDTQRLTEAMDRMERFVNRQLQG